MSSSTHNPKALPSLLEDEHNHQSSEEAAKEYGQDEDPEEAAQGGRVEQGPAPLFSSDASAASVFSVWKLTT